MTKTKKIVYYVVLVLVSALFLFAAYPKLRGDAMAIAGFAHVGLPAWFMYVIGTGEVLGVIGLWTRKLFRYAYEGLFVVLAGAIATTAAFVSVPFALFPLAVAILLGIVVWLHEKDAKTGRG